MNALNKTVIALLSIAIWNALISTLLVLVYRQVAVDHHGWHDVTWIDAFLTYLMFNVARAKFYVANDDDCATKCCKKATKS